MGWGGGRAKGVDRGFGATYKCGRHRLTYSAGITIDNTYSQLVCVLVRFPHYPASAQGLGIEEGQHSPVVANSVNEVHKEEESESEEEYGIGMEERREEEKGRREGKKRREEERTYVNPSTMANKPT